MSLTGSRTGKRYPRPLYESCICENQFTLLRPLLANLTFDLALANASTSPPPPGLAAAGQTLSNRTQSRASWALREADYQHHLGDHRASIPIARGPTWRWCVRVLSRRPIDFEEERKRLLFGFLTLVAGVMLTIFGAYHWSTQSMGHALMCFATSALLVFGVFVLRLMDDGEIVYQFITSSMMTMFAVLATTADVGSGQTLWVLGYPACALFVTGVRFGTFTSALLLAIWTAVFFAPQYFPGEPTYSAAFATRFIASYLGILAVAVFVEQVRRKYFDAMVENQRRLEADKAELKATKTRLTTMAMRDYLTGAANRRLILQQLDSELRMAAKTGGSLTIAMLDIDHFKRINDTHGHQIGDLVLIEVARRIGSTIRENDSLGRYGGEEFLIVLPGTREEGATQLVERVHQVIGSQSIEVDHVDVRVTASIGIASTDGQTTTTRQLIESADSALYYAKNNGRNQITSRVHNRESAA